MRVRIPKRGQTLVELAMILPILLLIIMAIIDFSYIVFGWSQVQFAARRAAEQGSKLPPREVKAASGYTAAYADSDACFRKILEEANFIGTFSTDTTITTNEMLVSWWRDTARESPGGSRDPAARFVTTTAQTDRKLLTVIEVQVNNAFQPLTPLGRSLFGDVISFQSVSRRSITSLDSEITKCDADGQ